MEIILIVNLKSICQIPSTRTQLQQLGTLRLHANIDELVPELGHVSIECWCLKPFASNSNSNRNSYIKVVAFRPLGLSFASGYISIEVDEACPGFTILNTSAAQCKWKINKKNLYSTQPNRCCPHMKLSHSVVCLGNKQKNLRAANMQLVAWSLSQGFPPGFLWGVSGWAVGGANAISPCSLHKTCSWNFPPSNFILEFHSSNFVIEIKVCKVSSKSNRMQHTWTLSKPNPSINWTVRQRTWQHWENLVIYFD